MEFKNFDFRAKLRLPLQWVMALLLSLLTQNAFANDTPLSENGSWESSGGRSIINNPRYEFTVSNSGMVDIWLENATNDCKADPYLYLLDIDGNYLLDEHGNHRTDSFNDDHRYDSVDNGRTSYCITNSHITMKLELGTYQLVAATFDVGNSGKFKISVEGANDAAVSDLKSLGSKTIEGKWKKLVGRNIQNFEDFSKNYSEHLYCLEMKESGFVTIDLNSKEDTYLFLLDKDKKILHRHDDISSNNNNSRLKRISLDKGTYYLVATSYSANNRVSAKYTIKLSSEKEVGFLLYSGSSLFDDSSTQVSLLGLKKNKDEKYVPNSVDLEIQVESKIKSFEHYPHRYHISHKKEVLDLFEWKDLRFNDWKTVEGKEKMFSNTIRHTLDLRLEDKSFYVHLMDTKGQIWTSPPIFIDINKDLLVGKRMKLESFDFVVKNSIITFDIVNLDKGDLVEYFIEEFSSSGELLASLGWKSEGMEKKSKKGGYKNITKGEIRYVPFPDAATLKFTVKNGEGKLSYINGKEIWASIDLNGKNNPDDPAKGEIIYVPLSDYFPLPDYLPLPGAATLKFTVEQILASNNPDDLFAVTKPPRWKDDGSTARVDADGFIYMGKGNYASQPWACFRDNRTGLFWEVKTNDDGIYGKDKVFSKSNDGLVQAANNAGLTGLCGHDDWREPSKQELLTLINLENVQSSIAFNRSYFPNTRPNFYWTSDPDNKVIDFENGRDYPTDKDYEFRKRLVRGTMTQ